jgi:CHAT domain-containing protein/Tfp pilus assembly protein PilF
MRFPIVFLCAALWAVPSVGTVPSGAQHHESGSDSDVDRKLAQADELFEKGQTTQSRQICESVLQTLPDRPSAQLAYGLNVMSKIYAADGDYGRAISFARRSADAYEQIRDFNGEAHALNNKGIAELQAGGYTEAQLDLEKALRLSQQGNDLENQIQVLNNLGSARYFRGSYSEAMRDYESALSMVNNNASAKWSSYWLQITRFNQATLLQRLGRYDGALRVYREVEASSKALTDSDRAHLEANLGTLYRRLGDPYKAMDAYVAAQKLYAKQHDADGELAVLKNVGIVFALDLGDLSHAASIFHSALMLAENTHNRREEMQAHLYLGETLFRSHALPLAQQEFKRAQTIANDLATTEEQWKSLYGLARIEALQGDPESAERDYRRAIALIEQSRSQLQLSALRSEFFADKRDAYDGLISILIKRDDVSEAFLFLEKSRARNFQDRMQLNQDSAKSTLTLERARATLDSATALLEFWVSGDQIGLVWCTRDTAGIKLRQLTPEQLSRIQAVLKQLPDSVRTSSSSQDRAAVDLPLNAILADDWLFPPGIHHLVIVPDGWLSSVPFDLVHNGRGSTTLLIEQYDITYLPTAALLRRIPAGRGAPWPWTTELVAFGDPVVNADVNAERNENQVQRISQPGIQDLPYSTKEIEDIAQFARGTSRLFLRYADLKKSFLSGAANSAPLLHVSTHAFADADRPENSRLLFSPDRADSAPVYVYLRELYDLDLTRVNLATISACDTERGKILRGEGVQAFSRSLLSAGAASSVTALWRVDDRNTAEFMRQFYYFVLRQNKPKAEALRLAKLKFLHSKSGLNDPSIWAAFVLNGDGLSPVPRVLSWTEVVLGAAGVVCGLVVILVLVTHLWRWRSGDRQQRPGRVVAE